MPYLTTVFAFARKADGITFDLCAEMLFNIGIIIIQIKEKLNIVNSTAFSTYKMRVAGCVGVIAFLAIYIADADYKPVLKQNTEVAINRSKT